MSSSRCNKKCVYSTRVQFSSFRSKRALRESGKGISKWTFWSKYDNYSWKSESRCKSQGIAVDKHSVPTKHSPSTVGIHNAPLTTSCEIKGEPNCTNTFTGTSGVDQTITSSTLSNSPVYQSNEQTFTVSLLGGEQNPRYLLKKFLNSKRTTTSLPPESLVSDETPFSNTVESSVPSCSNCVENVSPSCSAQSIVPIATCGSNVQVNQETPNPPTVNSTPAPLSSNMPLVASFCRHQ